MKKILALLILTVLVAFGYGLVLAFREEPQFYGDLNEQVTILRDGYDLPPLAQVKELDDIAALKCQDMAVREYYGHENPNGKQAWEQYEFGTYTWAGENLAHNYRNAMTTVNGWKASEKHLENILNTAYKEVGYAVCKDKQGYFLIVQIFRG